jgi:hypothetical protein
MSERAAAPATLSEINASMRARLSTLIPPYHATVDQERVWRFIMDDMINDSLTYTRESSRTLTKK